MGRIHALSENLIGKIAAGEVVERPASAVKELIENSLDAGATSINIDIRQDATDFFKVADNGCGIEPADLKLAFERHATSKIVQEDDLNGIMTLGFRGEALASIAAVGRVTLVTRTPNSESGIKVQNEGGQILNIEEAACPAGTSITVRDLFFNTPVRKSFLKRPNLENNAISDLTAHMILSRPDVSFRLITAGKTVYHSPGDGRLDSAILSVFGAAALKQMRKTEGSANGVLIHGFVGIGELARSSRSGEYFFINQRMMHSPALSAAIENACRERVMIGRFPVCILHLQMPYETVNVNVHPNKLEVRFQNEKAVAEAVEILVREALTEKNAFEKPVSFELTQKQQTNQSAADAAEKVSSVQPQFERITPKASVTTGTTVPPALPVSPPPQGDFIPTLPVSSAPQKVFIPALKEKAAAFISSGPAETNPIPDPGEVPQQPDISAIKGVASEDNSELSGLLSFTLPSEPKPIRIFGALFDTFILIEYDDYLLLVDQHAVHERLLFDQLMESFGKDHLGQELLIPVTVPVSRTEMNLLEENRSLLEAIGFSVEPFGETDVAVRSLPVILGDIQPAGFLRDIIGDLESGRTPSFEKKRAALLQTACKHAVKGGEKLTEDQLRHLVEQMIENQVTPTCPHGRPLVVSISHRELDKKFRRIQD